MEMISIIIPMYNEEEAIGGDLDTIIQTMSSPPFIPPNFWGERGGDDDIGSVASGSG